MASIKQVAERKYKITISNGYRTDGRKICKTKTIQVPDSVPKRGIEQYVYHEAERLERLFKQGYSEDAEMTFETYARGWLERQTKYAPGTIAFYRRSLETVFPEIGAIKLNELRPIALENLLAKLRKRTYRGKPIKEKTVQKYLTVVSAVLSDAKRNEIIEKNPARMIDLPDAERKVQEIPTMEEMQKFLSALCYEEPVFQLFYFLAISTGMRRGELCALRWSDIDLDAGVISINRTVQNIAGRGTVFTAPKTKRSRRCIKIGPECVQLLREYRQHQKAERFKVGSEWMRRVEIENGKTVDNDLLFTRWNGQPLDPNAVTSWFPGFLAAHDLPAVHFHSLRHTNASLLIAAHVPVTTVSGRLGHAKTSTTTDIYAGFIRSSDAAAADALTDVFSRIKEKTHA